MLLNELKISAFGQFKNRTFTFAQGLSVLSGDNEQGKSTLLACIKAMFFGLAGGKRTIRENERNRYLPWDGTPIAANLTFTHQGARYRLERVFGKSKANDQVRLMNDTTGQLIELPAQKEVGQFLFDVTAEEFVSTVFIAQLQSPLDKPDDSTLGKLGNLSSTLDEKVSYGALDKKLREAQVLLKLEKGNGGLIFKLQQQIANLTDERQQAVNLESEQQLRLNRLSGLNQAISASEKELEALEHKIQKQQATLRIQQFAQLKVRHDDIEKFKQQLEQVENQLRVNGIQLTNDDLPRLRLLSKNAQTAQADFVLSQQEALTAQQEYELAAASHRSFADVEGLDRVDIDSRSNHLLAMQEQSKILKEAVRYQAVLKDLNQAELLLSQRLAEFNALQTQWEQLDTPLPTAEPAVSKRMPFWLAGSLIILGLITGIFVHPVLFVLAAAGFVLIKPWRLLRTQPAGTPSDDQQRTLLKTRLDAAQSLHQEAKRSLDNTKNQLDALMAEISPDALSLHPDPDLIPSLDLDISRLTFEQKGLLSKSGVETLTELYVRLSQAETARTTLNRRNDQLNKAQDNQAGKERLARSALQAYVAAVKTDDQLLEAQHQAEADARLEQLTNLIGTLQIKVEQISQLEQALEQSLGGLDWPAYAASLESLKTQQSSENIDHSITADVADAAGLAVDLDTLNNQKQSLMTLLQQTRIEAGRTDAAIRHSAQMPLMAVEYDQKIAALMQQLSEATDYYDALTLARDQFTAAYEDLQATFGPVLNEKAALILKRLTGGKYGDLKIDRQFNIKVEAPEDGRFHEWDYYSGGTVDQIYLALRLAVSDLITDSSEKLPLLLDDIFVQYDDERTAAGIQFLHEKVAAEQGQALLLTSHNRISELAAKISPEINVTRLT